VGSVSTVTKAFRVTENQIRNIGAYVFLAIAFMVMCLPIVAFACLSFVKQYPIDMTFTLDNVKKLVSNGIWMYFVNSVAVALLTALIGTCFSYFSAYVTARSGKKLSNQLMHFISMLPLAIPGVVLGLSYVMTFKGIPLYGTIFMLVIVNIVHFFSSPYLMAYNSLSKFNPNLEDVAHTLGISRMKMLVDVYVPSTVSTLIEMYSYFFVNAMITISAVSFLMNFRTMPLALMIPQLESQSFIEGTAMVSMIILVLNLTEKGIAFVIKRMIQKEDTQKGVVATASSEQV